MRTTSQLHRRAGRIALFRRQLAGILPLENPREVGDLPVDRVITHAAGGAKDGAAFKASGSPADTRS